MTILAGTSTHRYGRGRPRRPRVGTVPGTAFAVDALMMALASLAALAGRERLPVFDGWYDPTAVSMAITAPVMLALCLVAIAWRGGYRGAVFGAGTDEYRRVVAGAMLAAGVMGVVCYLAKYPLSRGYFLLVWAVGLPLLLLGRVAIRRGVHHARRRGTLIHQVLVAGSRSHVDEIVRVLNRESWLGYRVIGALTPRGDDAEETDTGVPILGDAEDAASIIRRSGADTMFFAGGAVNSADQMRKLFWTLEQQQVDVVIAPSVSDISDERITMRPVGGLPLIHVDPPRWTDAARWGKRSFDIVGSAVLLVVLAPLFAFVALQVRRDDGGPVLFRQQRIGRRGDAFDCLKFRSMALDAEERLQALKDALGWKPEHGLFKADPDPRITRAGKWLRRFSLDELPQLVNVLRGDMSLVGPRPPLPGEVAVYAEDVARRLHVRPGMTGLWQVSGRSDLSWEEAVRLDLYYVDNWSMMQDLSILARTLGAVVGSRGAY